MGSDQQGMGFKTLFMVSPRVYVVSNGYQVYFSKDSDPEVKAKMMVPQWFEVDGLGMELAEGSTSILMPLSPGKKEAVKQAISHLRPETILFLNKLRRIKASVEDEPLLDTGRTDDKLCGKMYGGLQRITSLRATCRGGAGSVGTTKYFVHTQELPLPDGLSEPGRHVITNTASPATSLSVAFCLENSQPGTAGMLFSYLPLEECIPGLPAIVNGNFDLTASRESLKPGSEWNKFHFDALPGVYVNGFMSCLLSHQKKATRFSRADVLRFVPLGSSCVVAPCRAEFRTVAELILDALKTKELVPVCGVPAALVEPSRAMLLPKRLAEWLERHKYLARIKDWWPEESVRVVEPRAGSDFASQLAALGVREAGPSDMASLLTCLMSWAYASRQARTHLSDSAWNELILLLVELGIPSASLMGVPIIRLQGRATPTSAAEQSRSGSTMVWRSVDTELTLLNELPQTVKDAGRAQLKLSFVEDGTCRLIAKEPSVRAFFKRLSVQRLEAVDIITKLVDNLCPLANAVERVDLFWYLHRKNMFPSLMQKLWVLDLLRTGHAAMHHDKASPAPKCLMLPRRISVWRHLDWSHPAERSSIAAASNAREAENPSGEEEGWVLWPVPALSDLYIDRNPAQDMSECAQVLTRVFGACDLDSMKLPRADISACNSLSSNDEFPANIGYLNLWKHHQQASGQRERVTQLPGISDWGIARVAKVCRSLPLSRLKTKTPAMVTDYPPFPFAFCSHLRPQIRCTEFEEALQQFLQLLKRVTTAKENRSLLSLEFAGGK